jgi:hypothetical protein
VTGVATVPVTATDTPTNVAVAVTTTDAETVNRCQVNFESRALFGVLLRRADETWELHPIDKSAYAEIDNWQAPGNT